MPEKTLVVLVLVHGFLGWATRDPQVGKRDYFNGVQPFLKQEYGAKVNLQIREAMIPRVDSVVNEGLALKKFLEEDRNKSGYPVGTRIHLVAHSMGGLNARWVIAAGGMDTYVASLTTIGTPHQGTTLGDLANDELPLLLKAAEFLDLVYKIRRWIWRHLPFTRKADDKTWAFFESLIKGLGEVYTPQQVRDGVYALTLAGAKELKESLKEKERAIRARKDNPVKYFAYGGIPSPDSDQSSLLVWTRLLIEDWGTKDETKWGDPKEKKPGNDGAVSVWSAHYPWDDEGHDYVETTSFDHLYQINWEIPDHRGSSEREMSEDLKKFYREIMDNILLVQQKQ